MSDTHRDPFHQVEKPAGDVPVFDCRVYLSPPDEQGQITARVANLPEITCRAGNERDLLRKVVTEFKAAVARYHAAGHVPLVADPPPPEPGEQQRWLPVHL